MGLKVEAHRGRALKTRVMFWVTLEPLSDTTWRANSVPVEVATRRAFSISLLAELKKNIYIPVANLVSFSFSAA